MSGERRRRGWGVGASNVGIVNCHASSVAHSKLPFLVTWLRLGGGHAIKLFSPERNQFLQMVPRGKKAVNVELVSAPTMEEGPADARPGEAWPCPKVVNTSIFVSVVVHIQLTLCVHFVLNTL